MINGPNCYLRSCFMVALKCILCARLMLRLNGYLTTTNHNFQDGRTVRQSGNHFTTNGTLSEMKFATGAHSLSRRRQSDSAHDNGALSQLTARHRSVNVTEDYELAEGSFETRDHSGPADAVKGDGVC